MPGMQQQMVAQTAQTIFFGSQVGGDSVINVSYTDQPFQLLWYDIWLFFRLCWATPWIVLPLRPCDSGELDELSLTPANMWCVAVHIAMLLMQTFFILCIPVAVFFPIWMVATGLVGFFSIHWVLCRLLNGSAGEYTSDERYAKAKPEHAHEQWIFLNGVAVGEHWMKSNLNRLALTFGRPILGVHNQTNGILFDVIECLIQRNFQYANYDIRTCYKRIKEKLYDPRYSKVVFILHSQGGIEGGLVLDWLLQELPQDLLGKLEVYTFGCAANHFNSPHRHVAAQALTRDPNAAALTASPIDSQSPVNSITGPRDSILRNGHAAPPSLPQDASSSSSLASPARTLSAAATDRAIGHIEHYAHQTDFVAMWGVLHFATSKLGSHELPRFIGRLFVGNRGGHQFCQHYLDGMFPLARHPKTGAFVGAADESDFMNSVVQLGVEGDAAQDMREAFEISYLGAHGFGSGGEEAPVEVHGSGRRRSRRTVRVKDLSRLWLYRNGRSPKDVLALPRNATI